jgi:hypothetical protein
LCAARRTLLAEESLGMSVIDTVDAPDYGHIPIPPMLDYQLDTTMIRWMEAGMKQMLKQLWKVLLKRDKKDWFGVYLSIFILVHNLEVVYEIQIDYIRLYGDAVITLLTPQTVHEADECPAIRPTNCSVF